LIISIIDIKEKLGFGASELSNKSKQRIMVVDVERSLYGLLVDNVDQVMKIPSKEISAVPAGAFENYNYLTGVAKMQDKLILLLDVLPLIGKTNTDSVESLNNNSSNSSLSTKSDTPKSFISESPSQTEVSKEQPRDQGDIPDELKMVLEEDAQKEHQ